MGTLLLLCSLTEEIRSNERRTIHGHCGVSY